MSIATEFKVLPIDSIVPSKTNPRKHFDASALKELTESIKEKGVIVPLLVRPQNNHFELVAGERRYRGAKGAGLKEVPVQVKNLTDEEALEVQVVENLQRDDLHPLEEAEGFRKLLQREKGSKVLTEKTIAEKVGKPEQYVIQRLSLLSLIESAKKAFLADKINVGHAQLIARLAPEQQTSVMKEVFKQSWMNADRNLPGSAILKDNDDQRVKRTLSVKELDTWIRLNILLDLASAPWKKDDAKLLPKAGACAACPKRTGNQPGLFPDIKKGDVCSDPRCFAAKFDAHMARQEAEVKKLQGSVIHITRDTWTNEKGALTRYDYSAASEKDFKAGKAKKAIVVDGADRGSIVNIVVQKKKTSDDGGDSERYAQQARAAARRTKKEAYRRQLIMGALVQKLTKPLTVEQYRRVVRKFFVSIGADSQIALMRSLGHERPKGDLSYHQEKPFEAKVLSQVKTEIGMHGLLYVISLADQLHPNAYGSSTATDLLAAAKAYKVNLKPIDQQVAVKFPDARKKKAKKGGKK